MLSFTGIPGAAKLEERMEGNKITHLLTSHVALAFCYGVFLFLYEITLLRVPIGPVHLLLIGWSGCLFVYDVLVRQLWKKMPYWPLLLVFTVATGLTVLSNREVGLGTGMKSAVMTILPLCAFYPVCLMEKKENRKKALLISMLGAAVVVFLASLVALYLFMIRFSERVSFMGVEKLVGYRYYKMGQPASGIILPGFYEDTNHAAAFAVVFAAYSLMLYRECRNGLFAKAWQNKWGRIFAVVNVVVQIIYFPLANSRGGWVCLLMALLIASALWLYNVRLKTEKKPLRAVKAVALALVAVLLVYTGLVGVRTVTSEASTTVSTAFQRLSGGFLWHPGSGTENTPGLENNGELTQDSFQKTDNTIGSGRIQIWKDSVELFSKRPLLGDLAQHQYYAEKYDVGKYALIRGTAVHNSYLDLLVCNGILGFVPLMAFWVLCLIQVLKKLFSQGDQVEWTYYALVFAVLMTAGTSFFLSCVFVNTTATYFMMLVPTGYLIAQQKQENE